MPRISVGIRIKPEQEENFISNFAFRERNPPESGQIVDISVSGQRNEFVFDNLFSQDCSQQEIFDTTTAKICDSVVDGYNGCIFAYGQTGAGKTHTMSGPGSNDYAERGLCMRTVAYLFEKSRSLAPDSLALRLSVLEIYNEVLTDLLRSDSSGPASANQLTSFGRSAVNNSEAGPKLTVVDTPMGVLIPGLFILPLSSEEDAYTMLLDSYSNRMVAEHQLNRRSSRSHVIYTFYVTRTRALPPSRPNLQAMSRKHDAAKIDVVETEVFQSKLHLVDLAGSERVEKTKSSGSAQKEAAHINRSLTFLEQVVLALTQSKRDHIPYRQSKLTYILKDSLGGNSNTYMIACVWPRRDFAWETLSTLRFAARMKCIENTPIRNNLVAKADPSSSRLLEQINSLKKELILRDSVAGRDAWLPVLTSKQREQVIDQARDFLLEQPFYNDVSASCEGGTSKLNLIELVEREAMESERQGNQILVQSLSHVRALTSCLRAALWESCDRQPARIQEILQRVFPAVSINSDNGFDPPSAVTENEEVDVGEKSDASPEYAERGLNGSKENVALEAIAEPAPAWTFDEFVAGPGAALFSKYEEIKESLQTNKSRQSDIIKLVNKYKQEIDNLSEQVSLLKKGDDMNSPAKEAIDVDVESPMNPVVSETVKQELAQAKKLYRKAYEELQACREQTTELQSLKKRSLAALMKSFEEANSSG